MWLLLLSSIGLLFLLTILLISLAWLVLASMAGAPFVPAQRDRIRTVVEMTNSKSGMQIVDLGSGDGRVARAVAIEGACVDGYEIQPLLVYWSRLMSKVRGLSGVTTFYRRNLYLADCRKYDVVIVYGLPSMMDRLRQKFEAELRPKTQVISIAFPILGWKEVEKRNGVYLYKMD